MSNKRFEYMTVKAITETTVSLEAISAAPLKPEDSIADQGTTLFLFEQEQKNINKTAENVLCNETLEIGLALSNNDVNLVTKRVEVKKIQFSEEKINDEKEQQGESKALKKIDED